MDIIDPGVSVYLLAHCTPADDVLRDLAAETRARFPDDAGMQISHDEGQLLTMLARLAGASYAVEVGVFTGYSAICIARGLAEDGELIACELDPERAATARGNFAAAGVGELIDVRVGPAQETLDALEAEAGEPFDIAFIDADKTGYPDYYESCLRLLRPGGLIVVDNVLRDGRGL